MVVGGGNLNCMIKVTIYIERRGLEIKRNLIIVKTSYQKILKKVNNIFYFLSNFDLETVILFLVQF